MLFYARTVIQALFRQLQIIDQYNQNIIIFFDKYCINDKVITINSPVLSSIIFFFIWQVLKLFFCFIKLYQ